MTQRMSSENIATIQRLRLEGLMPAEIAKVTGISDSSCRRFSAGIAAGIPSGLVKAARERERARRLRVGKFTDRQMEIAIAALEVTK